MVPLARRLVRAVDPHEMMHAPDHAPHGGRILELDRAVHLVQSQALEGGALIILAADRTADLGDGDRYVMASPPTRSKWGFSQYAGLQGKVGQNSLLGSPDIRFPLHEDA